MSRFLLAPPKIPRMGGTPIVIPGFGVVALIAAGAIFLLIRVPFMRRPRADLF